MDLGSNVEFFDYIPTWNGNRDLPENEQLSLTIKRLSGATALSYGNGFGNLQAWRNRKFKKYLTLDKKGLPVPAYDQEQDIGRSLMEISEAQLSDLRVFVEHTSNFKNFLFGGEEKTDPLEIYFAIPIDFFGDELNLRFEILKEIFKTVGLGEDEVGN